MIGLNVNTMALVSTIRGISDLTISTPTHYIHDKYSYIRLSLFECLKQRINESTNKIREWECVCVFMCPLQRERESRSEKWKVKRVKGERSVKWETSPVLISAETQEISKNESRCIQRKQYSQRKSTIISVHEYTQEESNNSDLMTDSHRITNYSPIIIFHYIHYTNNSLVQKFCGLESLAYCVDVCVCVHDENRSSEVR